MKKYWTRNEHICAQAVISLYFFWPWVNLMLYAFGQVIEPLGAFNSSDVKWGYYFKNLSQILL